MTSITNFYGEHIGYRPKRVTPAMIDTQMQRGRKAFHAGEPRVALDTVFELAGWDAAASAYELACELKAQQQPTPLQKLVDDALNAFPGLAYQTGGSRAEAAAQYIEDESVTYLGLAEGLDWWLVGSYRTTIVGGRCTCCDRNAPSDKAGRLCKHRLAAMFARKLQLMARVGAHTEL